MKAKKPKLWIQKANLKTGTLREKLGVKEGKNIPASKLEKATKSKDPTTRKQAVLAQTFKKMRAKKK
jgi:hypothetical protein